jgi:tripartite-type tricarboxylate transporter receptor subunit TctC
MRTALLSFASLLFPIAVHAQTPPTGGYPARPIRVIVPFSAGSASDFLARQLAQKMTEHWGSRSSSTIGRARPEPSPAKPSRVRHRMATR